MTEPAVARPRATEVNFIADCFQRYCPDRELDVKS